MSTTRDLPLLPEIVTGAAKLAVSAAGGKSGDLWMIPPDHVHIDPLDNVRPLDPKHVKHLSMLIEEHGFDKSQPLGCIVKRIDGQDLVYVYSGQHRYHAAMLAIERGVHIPALPCVIRDAKTVNRRSLIITGVNNNSSEPLSPLDLAGAIDALKREGLTETEITQQLHITQQTVRDVMLLAAAPAQIHTMIRKNQIKSTLAIEQIRKHGPDKAAQLLEKTVDAAVATGKTKVTKKDLPKTEPLALDRSTAPKPTAAVRSAPDRRAETAAPDAAQLYTLLWRIWHDPAFSQCDGDLSVDVDRALNHSPERLAGRVDFRRSGRAVDTANEHGVFSCERVEVKARGKTGEKATIFFAQASPGVWVNGVLCDTGTSLAAQRNVDRGDAWPTRQSAISWAAFDIIVRLEKSCSGSASRQRKYKPLIAALEAIGRTLDPDSTIEILEEHNAFRKDVDEANTLGERDEVVRKWVERRRAQCEGAAK